MAAVGPFGSCNRVAVAVSGGADSMALAILLAGWGQPTALIVDHGLRPGSAQEAAVTARRLATHRVASRVLSIKLARGPGLAERARAARYAALAEACRSAGLVDLVVAHHAQDQAETLLLRRQAGSGPSGLAAMAAVTHVDAVRVLRPLLSTMPARLRATLSSAGVDWVEDPTNNDLATPRARMRADFRKGASAVVPGLCNDARRFGRERHAAEAAVAAELAGIAALLPCGVAVISSSTISAAAFSALVQTVSGALHPPPRASVARFDGQLRPATLHGTAVLRSGASWLIGREAAAQGPAEPCQSGALWDGRFRLRSQLPEGSTIGPLGDDAARLRRWSDLPAVLLRTLPAIRRNRVLFAVPHLSYPDQQTCDAVPLLFCPPRPVAPAPFASDRSDGDAEAA